VILWRLTGLVWLAFLLLPWSRWGETSWACTGFILPVVPLGAVVVQESIRR